MSLGARMREAREEKGMNQRQLAKKLGVLYHQVSEWERDLFIPRFDMIICIADALDVSLDWLAERENYKKSAPKPKREVWKY